MLRTTKKGITALQGVLSLITLGLSINLSAQECNNMLASSTPDDRFSINANATITDKQTGLIWKHCLEGQSGADCETDSADKMTWQDALAQADNSTFTNATDWRLPNIKELISIVELRCIYPAINATIFPNQPNSNSLVWSGSPHAAHSNGSWYVNFTDGNNGGGGYGGVSRSDSFYVRLVRSGQ
jgi:hypothetical protein